MVPEQAGGIILSLELFGLVVDNGSLLKLIDNRGKGKFDPRVSCFLEKKEAPLYASRYSCLSELGFDLKMGSGGLAPAHFAMDEFNKRQNAQLQFVRVLKGACLPRDECGQRCSLSGSNIHSWDYLLMLEAVDASVVKVYTAEVSVNFTDSMWLKYFHLVVDNECTLRLYHNLDNFFIE